LETTPISLLDRLRRILLERALAGGFFADPENENLLHTDPDLAPLRARPDFQAFVNELANR